MKITATFFYKIIHPLNSGGVLRVYNLLKNSDATIIAYGEEDRKDRLSKSLIQQVIAKKKLHSLTERVVDWLSKNDATFHIISSWFCKIDKSFIRTLDRYAERSDVLIAEFPYQFSLIKKYKEKLIIYDAHNVEYLLQKDILTDNLIGKILKIRAKNVERNACKGSNIIFTCSEEDKKEICSLYDIPNKKVFIVPNGIDTKRSRPVPDDKKEDLKEKFGLKNKDIILFIGSKHKPNLESVRFIVDNLAPKLPEKVFLIAGGAIELFLEEQYCTKKKGHFPFLERDVSACGFYALERWPGSCFVRWTQKECAFKIAGKISGLEIKMMCPKKIGGTIFVNGKPILTFQTRKEWQILNIFFQESIDPLIEIKLERYWKPLCSHRKLGIAISELSFMTEGKKEPIFLELLESLGFIRNNVIFLERFGDNEKKALLALSDIAINPMFTGSGTNLKMFEYMASGLPIVTTSKGARGIANKDVFIISGSHEFKYNIERLFTNKKLSQKLRENARHLVENEYDWENISYKMSNIIKSQLKHHHIRHKQQLFRK